MKPCSKCGVTKKAAEFHRRTAAKDKRSNVCRTCKAAMDRERKLLTLYDLPLEEYQLLYDRQEGNCYICGAHRKILNVDHDHSTGYVRGLICGNCNTALGHAKDNIHTLLNSVVYLLRPPFLRYLKEEHPERYEKLENTSSS